MSQILTDAVVRKLAPPAKSNRIAYDSKVAGFGVRVTASGAKAFILNYRTKAGRERRYTIGGWPEWQTRAARDRAIELKRRVDLGEDPLADIEERREASTVWQLCDRFDTEHVARKRPGTAADYRSMLSKHIRPFFGQHTKVLGVEWSDIDRLHRSITSSGHEHRANRVVAVLSKMFSLAVRWQMRTDNPCKGIERNPETKRRRYLKPDELARLTAALAEHPDRQAANIIRLLLLTGARRGEVLAMRWDGLDLDAGTWRKEASETKQKREHEVPLSAPARQLLSELYEEAERNKRLGKFVFPAHSKSGHREDIKKNWAALCKVARLNDLHVHDLRHSYASQLASAGVSLPMIGALLGHSNPTTTHRYAHLFNDPLREATERVGATISAAGTVPPEPVKLKGR